MTLRALIRPLVRSPVRAVTQRGGGWSPIALFAAGEQGGWWDPSDFSTMFQDSAGTTPVTAAGQPVGLIKDKSGRGNSESQGTTASRPLIQQDSSGYFRHTFDGVDDAIATTTGGGSSTGFFYCAAVNIAAGGGAFQALGNDRGTNTGYQLRIQSLAQANFIAGNGTAYTSVSTAAVMAPGGTYVVTAWDDGVNLNVQVNQGTIASIARPVVAAGLASFTEGRDNFGASSLFTGSIYARIYRTTVPSAAQIAQAQRFVAARAGVVL